MIQKVFIVGGGLMGSGIAQVAAGAGYDVVLNDISMEILERSLGSMDALLTKRVSRGRITQQEKDGIMGRIRFSASLEEAADCDWAIEAVVEDAVVKKSVLERLSAVVRENCILATNTSSISVAELSSAVKNPKRFLGMHFFSPVPAMKLLEIVRAIGTAPEAVETAREIGAKLGKVVIVARDSPAFIVNRMLDPMINEAVGLVENGTACIEDIDNAMKYGCNHPMGPLELIDMAGIDILLSVMEVLYAETGDPKYRPSILLRNMVRMKWLGRKTGRGFYVYSPDGTRCPNPDL